MRNFCNYLAAGVLVIGGIGLTGCGDNHGAGYGEIQESPAPVDTPAPESNLSQSAAPNSRNTNAGYTTDAQMQRNPAVVGSTPPASPTTQPGTMLNNTGTSQQNIGSSTNGGQP